ncbi:MAG: M23 family peptidase, partial [Proteobacteria bacterium]|nr:M23 family peptidase [Pseudomonadota bacterium]
MTKLGQSAKKKSVFTRVVMPLVLVGAALIAAAYLFLRDLEPPSVAIGPETTIITPGTEFSVVAADTKSGLMTLYIEISQNGNVREHFDNTFTERTITYTKTLLLNKELYQDGPIEIRAKARDSSLNPFGKYTIVTATYTLDSVRPTIAADSRQLNINQGGSGFISYTVNEAVQKTGVRVGTNFFPGYLQTGSTYFCLFAMPHDTPPGEFKPEILAIDLAGNENIRPLRYHANARSFKADRINLPESFLISKGELFEQTFPGDPETDPLGRYLKINTELRAKNRARLKEIGLNTSPTPLFDGAFLRAPGSTTAGFADNRDYYYQGVPVDNQTHL